MNDLNSVETTVTIDGKECKFTTLNLGQYFNGHHTFDIGIAGSPLPGGSIWNNERESIISQQGKNVVIKLKHSVSGEVSIFSGIITEVGMEGQEGVQGIIHYKGCSPTILLESGKAMDSFTDYNLETIVLEVAKKYGNGVEIIVKPEFKDVIPYIQMQEESGYAFLRRLAHQYGEWFFYNGRKLYFGNPYNDQDEILTYNVHIHTMNFGSKITPLHQVQYDYMPSDDRVLEADDNVRISGVNTYLKEALDASEATYRSTVGSSYNRAAIGDAIHLNRLLEIKKVRDTAQLTWVHGTSNTCRVRIGDNIAIKIPASMAGRQDLGRYRIVEVSHNVDAAGVYQNSFKGIPASMNRIPDNDIQIPECRPIYGTVVDNEDPENQGRVKVQFPWQEESRKSTNWIRVSSLDAGSGSVEKKNRGYVFIPEIGDQVMVSFELNSPNKPYVSGSMFTGKTSSGGGSKNSIKSIKTRSGHTLEFNDAEGNESITLKDNAGNTIIFKTNDKSMEITVPETLTISAKNLNIEVSEKINQTAKNMQVNIEENLQLQTGKSIEIVADKTDISVQDTHTIKTGNAYKLQSGDLMMSSDGNALIQADKKALLKGGSEARVSEG